MTYDNYLVEKENLCFFLIKIETPLLDGELEKQIEMYALAILHYIYVLLIL